MRTCRNCPEPAEFRVTVKHHRPTPDAMCIPGDFYFCAGHLAGLTLDAAFVIVHNNGNPCPRCGGKSESIKDLFTVNAA